MKLLSFEYEGKIKAGISEDGIKIIKTADDMLSLIKSLGTEDSALQEADIRISDVIIKSPIINPVSDVICLGMNYEEHSDEAEKWGKADFVKNAGKAVYFSKRADVIIGDGDIIDGHFDITDSADYEAELAVIIKKDAKNVKAGEAIDYVLGYSVLNDVSARNLQKDHKQFYFGKSLDTYTVMGPWIVTKDEFDWEPELNISCIVNGELRQNSNTKFQIFGIAHVIEELSAGMTLKAGTIIAMGTPAGVGMGFDPPKYLNSCDIISCSIEKIGTITNKII